MAKNHKNITLTSVVESLVNASSIRDVCQAMLFVAEDKLEKWDIEVRELYSNGEPFFLSKVRESLTRDIALLKGIVAALQ